jgi:hypothetical protein
MYAAIYDIEEHTYMNLTGRFPSVSIRGYKYILVLHNNDTNNNILAEPMKNRSDSEAIRAYTVMYNELTIKGLRPLFQTMDNEASAALKTFITSREMKFQFIPPHIYRKNAAERAIQTFKNHFIARICSTDKQFPLHLWLILHAIITLNLLRQSRINPKMYAYAQLNGPFAFIKHPLHHHDQGDLP